MQATVNLITRISRVFARLGGLLILLAAVLISLDVIFRNLFKWTLFESFELSGYAVAVAVTFGFAWSLVSKAHIRIEVIYNTLPIRPRGFLDALALGTLAVVVLVLTWWGGHMAWDSYAMGAHSNSTLAVPMAWPQGLWFLGLVWFSVCAVALFLVALYGVCTARFKEVQTLFGVASVEEEIELSVESNASRASGQAATQGVR